MSKALAGILIVALCVVAPVHAFAETSRDHYELWKVTPVPGSVPVRLLGQFDAGVWWDAKVGSVQFLANPTRKTHGSVAATISHPNLHLVAYSLQPAKSQHQRQVVINNQFSFRTPGSSTETWVVGQPELLLVPAGKSFPQEIMTKPGPADHFVCYPAVEPTAFATTVTLNDQFDRRKGSSQEITQLEPAYFCVPVQKIHPDHNVQAILDGETHLAIYKILPVMKAQFRVNTADQFGKKTPMVLESAMLGVPTTKVSWKSLVVLP